MLELKEIAQVEIDFGQLDADIGKIIADATRSARKA